MLENVLILNILVWPIYNSIYIKFFGVKLDGNSWSLRLSFLYYFVWILFLNYL